MSVINVKATCDVYDMNGTCLDVVLLYYVQPAQPYDFLQPLGTTGVEADGLSLISLLPPDGGHNSIPRGHQARGGSVLHELCPDCGLLGFRPPTGSPQFLPLPLVTRIKLGGLG